MTDRVLAVSILKNTFLVVSIRVIGRMFARRPSHDGFLDNGNKMLFFHDSGIIAVLRNKLKNLRSHFSILEPRIDNNSYGILERPGAFCFGRLLIMSFSSSNEISFSISCYLS